MFGLKGMAALGIVCVILAGSAYVFYLKYKVADGENEVIRQQKELVIDVNNKNAREAEELRRLEEIERKATSEVIKNDQDSRRAIDEIKKESRNAPDATNPAGPYWDDFGKRLRSQRANSDPGEGDN